MASPTLARRLPATRISSCSRRLAGWRPRRGPDGADADPIVTATRRLPAVPRATRLFPSRRDAAAARGAGGARHRAALHAPGRGVRARARRPQRRHHHADGVGQDALLQRAGARRDPEGSVDARAVSVSDQGARAGSARGAARARASSPMQHGAPEIGVFTYDGDTPSDARRAIRGKAHVVLSNPDMLHSGILPHHPRWAKLFENLKFVVDRRAARLSRRVRQPPVEHPAPAAARLPPLRIGSDLHLLVGDDRQSARARGGADRAPVRADRRRAARRAARSSSCSSIRRSSTRSSASGARTSPNRAASRSSSSSTTCS